MPEPKIKYGGYLIAEGEKFDIIAVVLTHYFEKKSQKTKKSEITRMKQIKAEFQEYRRRHSNE